MTEASVEPTTQTQAKTLERLFILADHLGARAVDQFTKTIPRATSTLVERMRRRWIGLKKLTLVRLFI